jgi:hypothetical protein
MATRRLDQVQIHSALAHSLRESLVHCVRRIVLPHDKNHCVLKFFDARSSSSKPSSSFLVLGRTPKMVQILHVCPQRRTLARRRVMSIGPLMLAVNP